MENMMFRTAFDKLFYQLQRGAREYSARGEVNQKVINDFIKIQIKVLSPFCPHIAEEMWEKVGGKGFVSIAEWPNYDEGKIDEKIEKEEAEFEKIIGDILNIAKILEEKENKKVSKVYLYVIPPEKSRYIECKERIRKRIGLYLEIYAVNDKDKYDPAEKANKAKMGRPSIYLE
jgi:leucyl-tRNA synthetase